MEPKNFYTHEEILDETFGKPGTPEREAFDKRMELQIAEHNIREIREAKKLTLDDLAKLIGAQKVRIKNYP